MQCLNHYATPGPTEWVLGFFPRGKVAKAWCWLLTSILMPRLGMSGAILLLPIYAFMARIREILLQQICKLWIITRGLWSTVSILWSQATSYLSCYLYTAFQNHCEEGFKFDSFRLLGCDTVFLSKVVSSLVKDCGKFTFMVKQPDLSKRQEPLARQHRVISHKTSVFRTLLLRASNITARILSNCYNEKSAT